MFPVAEKSAALSMREGAQRSLPRNQENNKRNWKTKVIICAKNFMQMGRTKALCTPEPKEGKQSGYGDRHIAQAWASSHSRAAV